ncbi:MAG: hypothetical protein AB9869_01255 [Verrucomicrobiia bacterium]
MTTRLATVFALLMGFSIAQAATPLIGPESDFTKSLKQRTNSAAWRQELELGDESSFTRSAKTNDASGWRKAISAGQVGTLTGFEVYDDFERVDGPLGTSPSGHTWVMLGVATNTTPLPPSASGAIRSGRLVSTDLTTVYAVAYTRQKATRVGVVARFYPGPGSGAGGAVGLISGNNVTNTISDSVHVSVWPTGWELDIYDNWTATTLLQDTFDTPLSTNGTPYVIELLIDGNTATLLIDGQAHQVVDSRISSKSGNVVYFEPYYSTTNASHTAEIEECWAGYHSFGLNAVSSALNISRPVSISGLTIISNALLNRGPIYIADGNHLTLFESGDTASADNSYFLQRYVNGTIYLQSTKAGAGAARPININLDGATKLYVSTNAGVGVLTDTVPSGIALEVNGIVRGVEGRFGAIGGSTITSSNGQVYLAGSGSTLIYQHQPGGLAFATDVGGTPKYWLFSTNGSTALPGSLSSSGITNTGTLLFKEIGQTILYQYEGGGLRLLVDYGGPNAAVWSFSTNKQTVLPGGLKLTEVGTTLLYQLQGGGMGIAADQDGTPKYFTFGTNGVFTAHTGIAAGNVLLNASGQTLLYQLEGGGLGIAAAYGGATEYYTAGTNGVLTAPKGLVATGALTADQNTTAGETRLLLWDVDAATLKRVSIGAADSGGTGYKVLRVPN